MFCSNRKKNQTTENVKLDLLANKHVFHIISFLQKSFEICPYLLCFFEEFEASELSIQTLKINLISFNPPSVKLIDLQKIYCEIMVFETS